jgi:Beta-propeller repeat
VTLIKFTPSGIMSWVSSFGSSAQDVAMAIATDEEANIYVAGYTYGKLGASDPQGADAWVSKRNPEGELIWIEQFGTNVEDAALAIAIHDSLLYVGGQWGNESDLADDQAFVRRYDLDGTNPVNHVFGTNKPEYAYGLAVTSDRIFVCGDTSGDFGGTNAGRYDAFLTQVVLP